MDPGKITGMLSYDNDLPLPVLVPMKTSFPSAKALKLFTWFTSTSTFYDNPSMVMITCRAQRKQTKQL
jgi:hypothetical protein